MENIDKRRRVLHAAPTNDTLGRMGALVIHPATSHTHHITRTPLSGVVHGNTFAHQVPRVEATSLVAEVGDVLVDVVDPMLRNIGNYVEEKVCLTASLRGIVGSGSHLSITISVRRAREQPAIVWISVVRDARIKERSAALLSKRCHVV